MTTAGGTGVLGSSQAAPAEFDAVLGGGAMINWITIDRADLPLYSDWYDYQHLPERVSTPGFLRGRRFVASRQDSGPRLDYLTVYETEETGVLASAEYLRRLDNPTELTQRVVPLFQSFRRAACTITVVRGSGSSARVVAIELDSRADPADVRHVLADRFDQLIQQHLVHAASLYEPDAGVSAAKESTAEGRSTNEQLAASYAVLVELHTGTDALATARRVVDAFGDAGLDVSQPRPAREFELIFELRSR